MTSRPPGRLFFRAAAPRRRNCRRDNCVHFENGAQINSIELRAGKQNTVDRMLICDLRSTLTDFHVTAMIHGETIEKLAEFCALHQPLFILTGAGCSTGSGLAAYRDRNGAWLSSPPVLYGDFRAEHSARQRYWLRSFLGWPRIAAAQPNDAHRALAGLERSSIMHELITQNVDGLHHRAGSRAVVELHGSLTAVICLDCRARMARKDMQERLAELNPHVQPANPRAAPDGDASAGAEDLSRFCVPACDRCGGVLKPDVVFFGESVPLQRLRQAMRSLAQCRGMLIIGSSLMVRSGYRFCLAAVEKGLPVAAINLGRTRADDRLTIRIEADCVDLLPALLQRLGPGAARTVAALPISSVNH